jgi:hypothetical protein
VTLQAPAVGSGPLPILELLGALVRHQLAARPPLDLPGGKLTVRGLAMRPEGADVALAAAGPLGIRTDGTLRVRVASVSAEKAVLDVDPEGGFAFRTAVGTALAAGGLLEPLVEGLLGRPMLRGMEIRGGRIHLSLPELVEALLAAR